MKERPKQVFLNDLRSRYGPLRKIGSGNSLFEAPGNMFFYIRYSKLHRNAGFFGLDRKTLDSLRKRLAYVCFVMPPSLHFLVPLPAIATALKSVKTAYDESFKVQVVHDRDADWLSVPGKGRTLIREFRDKFPSPVSAATFDEESAEIYEAEQKFTHGQIQRMMVRIGLLLGHDVWVPRQDRNKVVGGERIGDGCVTILEIVAPKRTLPAIESVDVIWLKKGSFSPIALFEIEHSTTIYSGFLRLNDILIDYDAPSVGIVSFEKRRGLFRREIARRTFEKSGLAEKCRFYNYKTIHGMLARLQSSQRETKGVSAELLGKEGGTLER